ncbi:MAG: 2-oxo acid dehydrogenase subunit E2 [Anaerolineae bacterium]|nr:2-oxo acid dehydrogenase subunit E2 [Anaerolineae bacterium]
MRQLVTDIGWYSKKLDPIIGLLEIDVTEARERIHAHAAATGERLSFTGFLVYCIGRAVDEHKQVHAMRSLRGRLVTFDDVDIATMIEIESGGRKTPVGRVIRAANHKTLRQIHDEIRGVQVAQDKSDEAGIVRFFARIPRFIRRRLMFIMFRMPQWSKQFRGTVVVTAVGMFGKGGGWGVGLPSHSLTVLVGGIAQKPGVVDGQIAIREYLCLTLSFDHAVVDGAPAARFATRLRELIESAAALETVLSAKSAQR